MSLEAIFFDRDGVINIDYGYVHTVEKLKFVDGIFDFCQSLPTSTLKFIVTNQAGIARGYFNTSELEFFMGCIFSEFKKRNIYFTDWRFCPHHPDFTGSCDCRKPKPGMINSLIKFYNLNRSNCAIIGDRLTDLQAGQAAQLKLCLLLGNVDDLGPEKLLSSCAFSQVDTLPLAFKELQKNFII